MPSVLVTGAGRGIGRAITEHLSARGWEVHATARSAAALAELATLPRVHPIDLDVTDRAAVGALAERLPERLDGVVNNAGIIVNGPLEAVAVDDLAHQLDVNVVAQVAVTQAVLPLLRAAHGRIVFMSSTSGRYAVPGTGAYNASKFALEAVGDALRMELRPWDIRVSLVEPGPIDTGMWGDVEAAHDRMAAGFTPEHRALYAEHLAGTRKLLSTLAKQTSDPAKVAEVVLHALTARRPRRRYLLDASSRAQVAFTSLAPASLTDAVLSAATTSRATRSS
ncbi:SDR family NAD(P)-dependent oxidoreductase [Arthrobacter sp. NEB 688]|uniref:SDR family NAD(P)-dependent oxidoreductase n=1 Tax=Arthrobacter sp. NEB 688 TaxID=904039 RepID=UPI001563783D|nr:SDR family NAD(P)-dependent oxidoreductase [Arthrobacter sp. NEB 688]QKE82642.1 SDR family NAD(P)-dependent oxidoreductase [Arthrobacter sp. NEB 688]